MEINGRTVMAQQPISQALWKAAQADPPLFMGIMANVRRALSEAIVRELAPPVTVHMPTELDEAVIQRLAEEQPTGCRCHNIDELCSGCRRCPDICDGCNGTDQTTT